MKWLKKYLCLESARRDLQNGIQILVSKRIKKRFKKFCGSGQFDSKYIYFVLVCQRLYIHEKKYKDFNLYNMF